MASGTLVAASARSRVGDKAWRYELMRVLLAYDGSAGATEAVALAEAIPWPSDSVLRVVSVIEPIMMPISGPWDRGATLSPELDAAITAYAHDTMGEVVERLGASGTSVEGLVLRGRAASEIIDVTSDLRADLVIVGSRGHGTIASLLLGSVSSEVVDHAPCPVLVARGTTLSRVVFATDESPSAQTAEAIVARWAIFDGLPIRVVSVADVAHPWTTGIAPTMYGQVLDAYAADLRQAKLEHQRIAADAAARLRDAGRVIDAEMRDGDAAGEIVAVAEQRGADLIVLGSRGRTGLTRLLLGSVARNVLSGSTVSVLIVRDGTEEVAEVGSELN
jgi:nucleotide-binding universal stress UspA family protein